MRRGDQEEFDPSKMVSGEWAVTLDQKKIYCTFGPGDVKQLMTVEDAEMQLDRAVTNATNQAKAYADSTGVSAELAETSHISAQNEVNNAKAEVVKAQNEVSKAQAQADVSKGYADSAKDYSDKAKEYLDESDANVRLSKSWAVGDTGERDGENTNNSKFYSDRSLAYANQCAEIEQSARALLEKATETLASVTFDVDLDTGLLYQNTKDESNIFFYLDNNGVLYYEVEVQ